MIRLSYYLVLLGSFALMACGGQNGTYEETKQEYIERVGNELLKLQGEIAALEVRADKVLTKDKEEFEAQLDTLGMKLNQAQEKFAKLKERDPDLEKMKSELNPLLSELERHYERTRDW